MTAPVESRSVATTTPPELGKRGRILEGLVTTLSDNGTTNISPMGPLVDEGIERLWLRPFTTSTTYRNLKRTGAGVFHVTDDVELIAHAAVGQPDPPPPLRRLGEGRQVLADACRWYAFEVETVDDSADRSLVVVRVVDRGVVREFFGFNRAKHAVLEAAILATRIHLLGRQEVLAEFDRLAISVEKTGAAAEHRALRFLRDYVEQFAVETEARRGP